MPEPDSRSAESRLTRRAHQARKLLQLLTRGLYLRGLRHGVGAAIEHRRVLRELAPRTVLDVGASKGQFSLVTRAEVPGARIHAFEPHPPSLKRCRALFAGDPDVTIHPVAAGETAGTMTLHVSARSDSSSLLPLAAQERYFPGTGVESTVEVPVVPLSERLVGVELAAPVLLKLDVQGYELPVLRGCGALLRGVDWILVECSFVELYTGQALAPEVADHLARAGFRLAGIFNATHDRAGRAVQADFLFRSGTAPVVPDEAR